MPSGGGGASSTGGTSMAQRRIGPTRGAGTVLIEQEGQKQIAPAALGWAGLAGIMEKGPTNKLIYASSATQFARRCGGIIDDSLLPDSAQDYYRLANGAGGLILQRVTDGNEVQAQANLYCRGSDPSYDYLLGYIKAHNGGRWGGKWLREKHTAAAAGDFGTNTLQMDVPAGSLPVDLYKGGTLLLLSAGNNVVGPILSSTADGLLTVPTNYNLANIQGGGSDLDFYIELYNDGKEVKFIVNDGEENPTTEFSLEIYVDGAFVKKYPNLHTDPSNARYWVKLINEDTDNFEIEAVGVWSGAHNTEALPANYWGEVDGAPTTTVLTAKTDGWKIDSPNTTFPDVTVDVQPYALRQVLTFTFTDADNANVASDVLGDLGTYDITGGAWTVFPTNKYLPLITIANASGTLAAGDVVTVYYKVFTPDELIGGWLYPDKVNFPNTRFRIIDNTINTITVAAGSDLTTYASDRDAFQVAYPQELRGGRDGSAEVGDAEYVNGPWDVDSSLFNRVKGQQLGLIKFATPGVTATAVQKAAVAYANAKNHTYRYEIPSGTTDEFAAVSYINDTIGRNDFGCCAFPSYGYVADPLGQGEGKQKLVSLTGMILGREARIAANWDGYHKAAAGEQAILNHVLDIPTGDRELNEEILNPAGLQPIVKKNGNFVIWGDRMVNVDPTWKWKHQREAMSYYEHVLGDNFDWIIFQINDPVEWSLALAALQQYFLPEWRKRALRGNTFQEAAIIKVDSEINTDATAAAGDMHANVSLKLADTVERFIITIGKQGVFEAVQ